jgi:D-mannonate dehydratase
MYFKRELMMNEEDEAFNEIEQRSKVKQELISSMNRKRQIMSVNPYRDQVIEEVAQHIEKLKSFGQPTVDGLAIYIRSMK